MRRPEGCLATCRRPAVVPGLLQALGVRVEVPDPCQGHPAAVPDPCRGHPDVRADDSSPAEDPEDAAGSPVLVPEDPIRASHARRPSRSRDARRSRTSRSRGHASRPDTSNSDGRRNNIAPPSAANRRLPQVACPEKPEPSAAQPAAKPNRPQRQVLRRKREVISSKSPRHGRRTFESRAARIPR